MLRSTVLCSMRLSRRPLRIRSSIARFWSWQDLNPLSYLASGYQAAKNYWYGANTEGQTGGNQGGKGESSSSSIELSTGLDPVPVYLDLSSVKRDEEEEETLSKIQNFGKVSLLLLLRFRKHTLTVLGKYMKVLFEDHYEYLLLIIMFFLL